MKRCAVSKIGRYIIVVKKGTVIQLPASKVLLIKREEQRTVIVTDGLHIDKEIECACTIKSFYEILDDDRFAYEHKSFIFNMDHIYRLQDKAVYIDDGSSLYLGKNCYYKLLNRFLEYRTKQEFG